MERKWVVFDVMGVIFEVEDDNNELLVPYVQRLNPVHSRDTINDLYLRTSLGELTSVEFWTALGFANRFLEIERLYLDTSFTLDSDLLATANQLAADFDLAILSNDVDDWASHLRREFDIDRLFKKVVISGEAKCRKPDPRIFEILLERLGAVAADCIFIDDKASNLETAKTLSFKTVLLSRQGKTNSPHADFEITRLSELPEAVARAFAG